MSIHLKQNFPLETERLHIRPFTLDDSSFILKLMNTEGWLQFIGDRNIRSEDDAKQYLRLGPLQSYTEHGFGLCMVQHKTDAMPLGMCGLLKRDYLDAPDIGFAFLPEYSGKGYALESAREIMRSGIEEVCLKKIYAIVLPSNTLSIRLLGQLGMTFERKITPPHSDEVLHLFAKLHPPDEQ